MAFRVEGSAGSISGVARSSVSPITCSGVKSTPNRACDTFATSCRCSSLLPAARHRGGGADADGTVAKGDAVAGGDAVAESVAAAADEHRDVRALAAPVGVQLVEDEELEALGGPHQLTVLAAREQQLQHHVVRQEDVRRIVANRLADGAPFLPRIACEAHRRPAFRVALVEKLPELLGLAVGEGVHGVDDDGPDALAGPVPKHVVHDRHDVGEALAGAGAGGQHAGASLGHLEDRLALVAVEVERLSAVVRVGLADPEDARAFLVEHPFRDQIVDRAAGAERRVQLEERFRPEPLRIEDAVDELPRSGGSRILMKLRV